MSSARSGQKQSFADRLYEIRRASQSRYIIVAQQTLVTETSNSPRPAPSLLASSSNASTRTSPHSDPASPIAGVSLAPYAIDANTLIVAQGQLEEGGFESLRQQLLQGLNVVQYVVVRFCGRIVMVQCVGADVSSVRRARAAVFGRSLAHMVSSTVTRSSLQGGNTTADDDAIDPPPVPPPLAQIVIDHPRQLTDPLLRTHLNSAATASGSSALLQQGGLSVSSSLSSVFEGASVPALSPSSPFDVPRSVWLSNFPCTPPTTNWSTLGSAASMSSVTHKATAHSPFPFPPVGLGINVVDSMTDGLYEMSKTDASVKVRTEAGESPTSPLRMIDRPWRRVRRSSNKQQRQDPNQQSPLYTAVQLSPDTNDGPLSLVKLSFPSRRASYISQATSSSGGGGGTQQAQAQRASLVDPQPVRIASFKTPSTLHRDASSRRLRTSYSSSSLSSFAFLCDQSDTHSIRRRQRRQSNPQDSANDAAHSNEELVRLEHERVAFVLWRKSQERAMLVKERLREQQRRMHDEATRERVMQRLMIEQGVAEKLPAATIVSSDNNSLHTESWTTVRGERTQRSSSMSCSVSFSDTTATIVTAKRAKPLAQTATDSPPPLVVPPTNRNRSWTFSASAASLPKAPPPGLPLPPIPSSSSEASDKSEPPLPVPVLKRMGAISKGKQQTIGFESTLREPVSPLSSLQSPTLSLDLDAPRMPIDARSQEAIMREMRRPVVTMEGHIRPRVQVRPVRLRTTSADAHLTSQSLVDENGKTDIGGDNALVRSLIQAQRKCARGAYAHIRSASSLSESETKKGIGSSEVAVVRTMVAYGHSVGAGWALDLTEKELSGELESPKHVDISDAHASVDWTAQSLESKKDSQHIHDEQSSKMSCSSVRSDVPSLANDLMAAEWNNPTTYETSYDQISPLEHRARSSSMCFPRSAPRTPAAKAVEIATPTTLIDRVFADAVNVRPRSTTPTRRKNKALPAPPTPSAVLMQNFTQMPVPFWTRQEELDTRMDGLKREHSLRVEAEACARARWAHEQVQRQQLNAYERSRLESDERARREASLDRLARYERERRAIEAEQRLVAQYEEMDEQRRGLAQMTLAARREREQNEKREEAKRQKERQRVETERKKRHSALRKSFVRMKSQGIPLAQGIITLQSDDSMQRRRRYYVLRSDGFYLYAEAKAAQVASGEDVRAVERIDVTPGRLLGLSDAYETVQVKHSFSLSTKRLLWKENELCEVVETLLAYTDEEADKERLIVGLAWLAGLAVDLK